MNLYICYDEEKRLLYKVIKEEKKQVYIVTDTGKKHNIYLQLGFKGAVTHSIHTECCCLLECTSSVENKGC